MMKLLLAAIVVLVCAACETGSHRSARPDFSNRGASRDAGVLNHGTSDMNSGGFQDPYGTMPPPVSPR